MLMFPSNKSISGTKSNLHLLEMQTIPDSTTVYSPKLFYTIVKALEKPEERSLLADLQTPVINSQIAA